MVTNPAIPKKSTSQKVRNCFSLVEQESKEDKPSLAQRNLVCSNQMKNSQSVQQTQISSNGISPVFKTPKTAFPQVLRFLGFEFALDRLFYIRFGQTKLR